MFVWKEKESSIKSWDWLTVLGKTKKKFGKDKIMTSKKRNKKLSQSFK